VPVEHRIEPRAGNEKRLLVGSNALFCGAACWTASMDCLITGFDCFLEKGHQPFALIGSHHDLRVAVGFERYAQSHIAITTPNYHYALVAGIGAPHGQGSDRAEGHRMIGLAASVEHCVERRGETLMTAREAGTPTRLVRSNALFDALSFMRCRSRNH